MLALIVLIGALFGLAALIRLMARHEILWVIVPANTYALVTTEKNGSGRIEEGGGGVTTIVHNVEHKKLVKGSTLMDWHFVDGRERHGLLFVLLGVQWIGPFRYLRTNVLHRFRYKKIGGEKEYDIQEDDLTTKYIPYSGDLAVMVTKAESQDIFELDFLFGMVEEATYPYRAVIRVGDANAILAGMLQEKVNAVTGTRKPEDFLKASPASTKLIVDAAKSAIDEAEAAIGKKLTNVNLLTTDMDEEDRKLFELEAKTDRQNRAALMEATKNRDVAITESEGAMQAQLNRNKADADRIERVVKPAAETPLMVAVRLAEAYENNETVTVFAPGSNALIPLPANATK